MFELGTIALVAFAFLLAGLVKGVVGLGLPSVSLGILAATIGLPQAMAVLIAPSFVTNLWQAVAGGKTRAILGRIWPFLLMATLTVWIGTGILARGNVALLTALLGVILILYSAINLRHVRVSLPAGREGWLGPVLGAMNGVIGGMTGSFVLPGVLYLQAIGLSRDMLIQAMGMLFTLSTVALGLALGANRLLTLDLGFLSAAAVLPAMVGMQLGQIIRKRLSDEVFRRVLFIALMALGAYILIRALT